MLVIIYLKQKLLKLIYLYRKLDDLMTEMHLQDAPDDFRAMSIFPQMEDLNHAKEIFIRTNLIGAAYQRFVNVKKYCRLKKLFKE